MTEGRINCTSAIHYTLSSMARHFSRAASAWVMGSVSCVSCMSWSGVVRPPPSPKTKSNATNQQSPSKLACVCSCLWASTSTACNSTPNMVRHDICRNNYAVETGLVVGFCGQPHCCYWTYYPTARFRSPSSNMVSDEQFPDRSRHMLC